MNLMKTCFAVFVLVLMTPFVTAIFTDVSVNDADKLYDVYAEKEEIYRLTNGISDDGKVVSAGIVCLPGEYIRFLKCPDATATACEDIFTRLWYKSSDSDLLKYTDYPETQEGQFWATYVCYGEKGKTRVKAASSGCALSIDEGTSIKIEFDISDPDKDKTTTTYDFGKLEQKISKVSDNLFQITTTRGDRGVYDFTATTSDGQLTDTTKGCIEVLKVNSAPEVFADDVTVNEGDVVKLSPRCEDYDKEDTTMTISGWMDSLQKQTGYRDAGTYKVTVTCTDVNGASTSKDITVTVINVNTAPDVVATDVSVNEGDIVKLDAKCVDKEGDETLMTISGWMDTLEKQTGYSDAGTQAVDITCSDPDGASTTKTIQVTISNVNRAPVLTVADVDAKENEQIVIPADCTDPDGDTTQILYDGWMTTPVKQLTYDDAGVHDVTVTCVDTYGAKDVKTIKVNVANVNRPPVVDAKDITINEGQTARSDAICNDPENDETTIAFSGWLTGPYKSTGYDDAGTYTATVTCTDVFGASSSKDITITVVNVNRPPTITWVPVS